MNEKSEFTPLLTLRNEDIKKKSAIFFLRKKEKKKLDFEWELPKQDEIIYILKKERKERTHKDIKALNDYLTTNLEYFRTLKSKSDPYQYERTLYVLKYEEVKEGKNIVTFDEEGDKCYILLEGAISILKPLYTTMQLTIKEYVYYLKELDRRDPSNLTRNRVMEKNSHIEIDVLGLMKDKDFIRNNEDKYNKDKYNIFVESFEKVFEAKDGFSFGETALLHKQKRNATILAEKLCKLIYIDKFDYNRVLKEIEKKRIDENIKKFVKKFNFFSRWGYNNLNKLYSLMTDLQLSKDDFVYRQNEDSEYIYFCIDGVYEIYTVVGFGWKKQFIKYITDTNSNFFLKVDPNKRISDFKLMKIISESKNNVPPSPMISSQFDSGKCNIGLIELNNIEELIIKKEEKFNNPFDLFKINMNYLDSSGILGMVEAFEFKKRFASIRVKSKIATLKRIKATDFFKVLVSNQKDERNDELMLNYFCEKKKSFVTQILLNFNYKKNIQLSKYIEEYKKCYSSSNYNKPIKKSLANYINTLSTNPTNINKTKNIFKNKKSKISNPKNVCTDLLDKISNEYQNNNKNNNKNNNYNESFRSKWSSKKINDIRMRPISASNNEKLFIRNNKYKLTKHENKKDIQNFKLSSFSPYIKNSNTINLKEEIKNFGSYETTLSSSNFSNPYTNLSKRTIIAHKKNHLSLSNNKNKNSNISRNIKKIKLEKEFINTDKMPSFNIKDYKKNLYFRCGFFINETIRLGLGPNIPLRREMMFLNDNDNLDNNMLNIESNISNNKNFSMETNDRKRRNYFLKITSL